LAAGGGGGVAAVMSRANEGMQFGVGHVSTMM
jgi:hypothetical protein